MRILVIEDDPRLCFQLAEYLRNAGHIAASVMDERSALHEIATKFHDVIVLDRKLQNNGDGFRIVRRMRLDGDFTPVLMISGFDSVNDRIAGLRAGVNDYLGKPFAFEEMLARLEALTRPRRASCPVAVLRQGDIEMDLISRVVIRAGVKITLQPKEFKLLEYFVRRPLTMITRMELLEGVWRTRFDPGTSVVEVHLSRLRRKIDAPFELPVLHTLRNEGFIFRPAFAPVQAEEKCVVPFCAPSAETACYALP